MLVIGLIGKVGSERVFRKRERVFCSSIEEWAEAPVVAFYGTEIGWQPF